MNKILRRIVFVLSLFAATVVYAQNDETTLTGTVMDTTGAKLPNATIHLVNAERWSVHNRSKICP